MLGFVSIQDYDKARAFCESKRGFAFVSQDQFALVMSVVGHEIRMTKIPNFTPAPGTVRGWEVDDMQAKASLARESLREPGKAFFRRTVNAEFGRLRSGDQVARLKDPDANIVSGGPSLRTGVVW